MSTFFATLVLIAAVFLGIFLKQHSLPMVFTYQDWSVEMPLWLAVILAMLCIGAFIIIYQFFSGILFNYALNKYKSSNRKNNRSWNILQQALISFAEGNAASAEKKSVQAAKLSKNPFFSYLTAAKAAHAQQAWQRRDDYLQLAIDSSPKSSLAVNLTKAQLQLNENQLEEGLATIESIQKMAPKHPQLLTIKSLLYKKSNNWTSLCKLLPKVRKYSSKDNKNIQPLELYAYKQLLIDISDKHGKQTLIGEWKDTIPKTLQKNLELLYVYIGCLIHLKAYKEAEYIIKKAIKKSWDDKLIELYGLVYTDHLSKQISFAESLVPTNPNNHTLLLALARLCIKNKLWGKARNYLESSVNIFPTASSYAELAKLLENLGDHQESNTLYKKGLLTLAKASLPQNILE